jgi:peroxiredoxin
MHNINKLKQTALKTILYLVLSGPFMNIAQQLKGYSITGNIQGLEEGEKVTMMCLNYKGQGPKSDFPIPQDSAYVKGGKFFLSGYVPEGPREYWMVFDRHTFVSRKLVLYIDNGQNIIIHSPDIVKINHEWIRHYVTVEGSSTNYSMLCLEPAKQIFQQSVQRVNRYISNLQDSIGFNANLLDIAIAFKNEIIQAYYFNIFYGDSIRGTRNPELYSADIFLPTTFKDFRISGHASFWIDFYNEMDVSKKNSFHGKWLKNLISLCVGQKLPEFTLPMANGISLALNDVVQKSKVTLIHFWASNSLNRLEYQDELRILYKRYHNKGLNIIGISTDEYIEKWNEILKKEQYPWLNVIDMNGKMTEQVYYEYGGDGYQRSVNVLLDETGKIIAWDVSGGELLWYIQKYLE